MKENKTHRETHDLYFIKITVGFGLGAVWWAALLWKLKKIIYMTLTIQTTVLESRKVEASVAIPSFWKDPCKSYDSYRAVIDENTFIEFHRFWDGDIVSIENSTVERRKEKIIEAQTNPARWVPITEDEFMKHYDDAFECMRLHAKLAV